MLSRVLKVKLKWIRVPTADFERKKIIIRGYNPNPSNPSWKHRWELPGNYPVFMW